MSVEEPPFALCQPEGTLIGLGVRRRYCDVAAARAALKSVGLVVLRRHIETCVADALESRGTDRARIIEELIGVLSKED